MRINIFYFSRTGNSKRIAEKLSTGLGCGMTRITDDVSWKGFIGWFKGGFYSVAGKKTNVKLEDGADTAGYDKVILVAPVWAGSIVPAGYSFLEKYKDGIRNLCIVLQNEGSETDAAFARIEEKVGKISRKYGITKKKENEDRMVNEICRDILE